MNILTLLSAFILICSHKTPEIAAVNTFYTAAVIEFKPTVEGMNSSEMLADHLKSYLNILESGEAADADIVVFPEGTLNNQFHLTYVPSEKTNTTPCLADSDNIFADFLVELSCAARRVSKYLVINLTEKENCPADVEDLRPCASNNLNIFNTNVVFDREGRVVSRYRKVHVYVEKKNTTYMPELALFDTDFGVRFGHFICFDILFYTPAQELVDRFGVKDFIFTSFFYSELPFLTAVQLQHGWAWGNDVNLLAAGASYPQRGTTGSGIYSGHYGDLVSVMVSKEGVRKLYKARVPIRGSKFTPEVIVNMDPPAEPRSLTGLRILRDPQIENYKSALLDITQAEEDIYLKKQLCHGDICCSFEIIATNLNYYQDNSLRYRVGVFDGRRTYEKEVWSDIKVCALYACANEQLSSCGAAVIADNVLFKTIDITGNFPIDQKVLIMPSMVDDRLYPLNHNVVMWSKEQRNHHYEVNLKLSQSHTAIMTFGIYGQYFENSATSTATTGSTSTFAFILISFLLSFGAQSNNINLLIFLLYLEKKNSLFRNN